MKSKLLKKKYTIDDEEDEEDETEVEEFELAFPTRAAKRKNTAKKTKKPRRNKKKVKPLETIEEEEDQDTAWASCVHPIDNSRRLWFVSDFPHLVKSIKQRILNAEILEVRPY